MKLAALLFLLLCAPAMAQNVAQPNVASFGAKGDCSTDDTAAFNAYAAYLRGLSGYQGYKQFNMGISKCYALAGSVNWTALSYTRFEGNGSILIGEVSGYAVLDAMQTSNSVFENFSIIGQGTPLNGLQIGRALAPGTSTGIADTNSSNNSIQNVYTAGPFTRAGIYVRASEVSNYVNDTVNNSYSGGYAQIMDGDAHFQVVSQYGATYNPNAPGTVDNLYPYSNQSFGDETFLGGSLVSSSGVAVWMSNAMHHQYHGVYVNSGLAGPATDIYFHSGDVLIDLVWDVHSESTSILEDILVTGAVATPVLNGLTYTQHIDEANNAIFARDTGVTSVTVHDLNFAVHGFLQSPTVFDVAADWTVDGYAYAPSGAYWNLTSTFTGLQNLAGTMTVKLGGTSCTGSPTSSFATNSSGIVTHC